MGSGELPGLQNRRAAPLVSPVRSTRTRFRHFTFREMQELLIASQFDIEMANEGMCDKNVITSSSFLECGFWI